MRSALWTLALFACAVAAALFLGSNRATVALFWHPWRIDLSLNLLLVGLALFLALAALLAWAIASVWRMPTEAKIWRDHRHDLAAHHAFARAAEHLAQERWEQALEEAAHVQHLLATLPPPASARETREQQSLLNANAWLREAATRAQTQPLSPSYAAAPHGLDQEH